MTATSNPTPQAIVQHGFGTDDSLVGTDGDDALYGEGGNDQLYDSPGTDLLDGGDGNDTINLDFLRMTYDYNTGHYVFLTNVSAGDQLIGGAGDDSIQVHSDNYGTLDLTQVSIAPDIEHIRLDPLTSAILTSDQLMHFETLRGNFTIVGSGTYQPFGGRLQGGLTLGSGDDVASLLGGGNTGYLHGGAGNDTLTAGNETGSNTVFGDEGNDTLIAGSNAFDDGTGANLIGGAGDDTLQGGRFADALTPGPGADIVDGGGGDDTIYIDELNGPDAPDQISGGAGIDTLATVIDPNAHWTLDLGFTQVATDVERIAAPYVTVRGSSARLDQFESIVAGTIQFTDAVNIVPIGKYQVSGYALSAPGGTIDASASHQAYTLSGAAGDDHLLGGSADDQLYSGSSGTDTLSGGGGDDGLYFGGSFGPGDVADGGAGTDTLALQGNYAGLNLTGMSNIEVLLVASGSDTRFGDTAGNSYDYNIASVDANVPAGGELTIIATGLGTGEDLHFDGSAESDGSFAIFAGRGTDDLRGGAGSDGFFFGAEGNFTAADHVDGGGGADTLALRGDYTGANALVLGNGSMANVEVLALLSSHTNEYSGLITLSGYDYDVTLADGNVAAGQTLDIAASRLGADESVRLDGHAETDGSLRIFSGAGDDILIGGGQADLIYGGLGADQLDGRGGADSYVYRSVAESTAESRDTIAFIAGDHIDLSQIDANAASAGSNEAFAFIGSAAFSHTAGELRAFGTGSDWTVEADVNGDGVADLVISVSSVTPLTASDFVL